MLGSHRSNYQLSEDAFWSLQAALAKTKGKRKRSPGNLQGTTSAPVSTVGNSAQAGWVRLGHSLEEGKPAGPVAACLRHREPRTREPTASDSFSLNHDRKSTRLNSSHT